MTIAFTGAPPTPSGPALLGPLGVAAAVTWVLTHNPTDTDTVPDPGSSCVWTALTGTQGLSCGGTRMTWYLLHGDVVQAARHHLPALLAVPFLSYTWARWTARSNGRRLPASRCPAGCSSPYAASWLAFPVARNLPWPPST